MRADSWTKLQLKPMVDTAGKKLKQARLRKQLSLEEVARGTKIRVPRLADLEADDYTNFPSMSYVRGFLSIYAKYLGIDVSEFTDTLGSSATSVGIGDYEYLSNGSERVESVVHRKPKRSIWPLVILGFLVGMGVVAALVANFVLNAKRLGNLDELGQKHLSENAAPGSRAQEVPSQPAGSVAQEVAVVPVGVLDQVPLMVVLRGVELSSRGDLGGDWPVELARRG